MTTTAGDVTVSATNDSLIEAQTLSAMSSGAESVGIELAFNTIGWKRSNILFCGARRAARRSARLDRASAASSRR